MASGSGQRVPLGMQAIRESAQAADMRIALWHLGRQPGGRLFPHLSQKHDGCNQSWCGHHARLLQRRAESARAFLLLAAVPSQACVIWRRVAHQPRQKAAWRSGKFRGFPCHSPDKNPCPCPARCAHRGSCAPAGRRLRDPRTDPRFPPA